MCYVSKYSIILLEIGEMLEQRGRQLHLGWTFLCSCGNLPQDHLLAGLLVVGPCSLGGSFSLRYAIRGNSKSPVLSIREAPRYVPY